MPALVSFTSRGVQKAINVSPAGANSHSQLRLKTVIKEGSHCLGVIGQFMLTLVLLSFSAAEWLNLAWGLQGVSENRECTSGTERGAADTNVLSSVTLEAVSGERHQFGTTCDPVPPPPAGERQVCGGNVARGGGGGHQGGRRRDLHAGGGRGDRWVLPEMPRPAHRGAPDW